MIRLVVAMAGCLGANGALACEVTEPLRPADFAQDAAVVVARIDAFTETGEGGRMTVWPLDVLRGTVGAAPLDVVWPFNLGGLPQDPGEGAEMILGLVERNGDGDWVVRTPLCGTAHVIVHDAANRQAVAAALAAGG
jgi:hypothetical protein